MTDGTKYPVRLTLATATVFPLKQLEESQKKTGEQLKFASLKRQSVQTYKSTLFQLGLIGRKKGKTFFSGWEPARNSGESLPLIIGGKWVLRLAAAHCAARSFQGGDYYYYIHNQQNLNHFSQNNVKTQSLSFWKLFDSLKNDSSPESVLRLKLLIKVCFCLYPKSVCDSLAKSWYITLQVRYPSKHVCLSRNESFWMCRPH